MLNYEDIYGIDYLIIIMLSARDFAPSDEKCIEIIQELRWKKGVRCVFCGSELAVRRGRDKKGFQRYLCRDCGRSFNDRTKTVFDGSRLKPWEWFYMIKEHSANRSIYSIALDLGRPYNTIYYSIKKVKEDLLATEIALKMGGNVEMDETYMTAGEKGDKELSRAPRKRGGTRKRGRGGLKEGKIPVVAVTERGGRTIFFVALEGLSKELVLELLNKWVEKGSIIHTDDFTIYTNEIEQNGFKHRTIPRYNSKKKFAEGNVHINNAENRFSFLKSWYRIFRGISKKCLGLWINFFQFLSNLRGNLIDKTLTLIENVCILKI